MAKACQTPFNSDVTVTLNGSIYKELWELANNHGHMLLLQKEQYESQMKELKQELEEQKARTLKAEQGNQLAVDQYGEMFMRCMQAEQNTKQITDLLHREQEKVEELARQLKQLDRQNTQEGKP